MRPFLKQLMCRGCVVSLKTRLLLRAGLGGMAPFGPDTFGRCCGLLRRRSKLRFLLDWRGCRSAQRRHHARVGYDWRLHLEIAVYASHLAAALTGRGPSRCCLVPLWRRKGRLGRSVVGNHVEVSRRRKPALDTLFPRVELVHELGQHFGDVVDALLKLHHASILSGARVSR